MFNYIPTQWLFLFYFYSFAGWCWETLYVSILEKRFVNRGFMRGPFLPLYGCSGIMMLVISRPFYDNIFLLYIAGCIGATILELITGIVMEALFKVRYWTYSHKKFNFKGYICLESSLFWGVPTVVFTHYLQLPIEKMLMMIPFRVLSIMTIVLTAYISFDFAVAFRTAIELRDVLIYMEKAKAEMSRMQKRLDVLIAFKGEEVKEGIESRVDGITEKVGEIGSGIGSTVEAISSGIGSRLDVLSSSLEKSFNAAKEKISLNPSAYVKEAKDEVFELYTKYRIMSERFTPKPIKSFFDWYRNRTLLDTNMDSDEYKLSLQELKERASKNNNKTR
ncbi:MAG: hypothetical protein II842_13845 [Butyrivibrio sp.]|nr:hypothetical protein [Butyrivibrio sp.]